jgi:hypothetical protein
MSQKVVINVCHGGFGLSTEALEFLGWTSRTLGNKEYNNQNRFRTSPELIRCVETLKAQANGRCADLEVIKIPDDVEWEISEYDGYEHVAECHRTWP